MMFLLVSFTSKLSVGEGYLTDVTEVLTSAFLSVKLHVTQEHLYLRIDILENKK